MKLPEVLYVCIDGDKGEEYFLAYEKIDDLADTIVGVYDLREKLHTRKKTQIRREGAKTWFDT